jgi:hypothetical protein
MRRSHHWSCELQVMHPLKSPLRDYARCCALVVVVTAIRPQHLGILLRELPPDL